MLADIFETFGEEFQKKEEERRGKLRRVGVELKFPVVKADGEAIEKKDLLSFWQFLSNQGWETVFDPAGKPTGVKRAGEQKEDFLSAETGFCKVEFSLGHTEHLFSLAAKIRELAQLAASFCAETGIILLGLGIQPLTPPGRELFLSKPRNLFWQRAFKETLLELFTVNASLQVHVDMAPKEVVQALNVFNGLAGVQIALNANSTVWQGKVDERFKALNEAFWEWWLPGDRRVGMPFRKFSSFEDYFQRICAYRPVYVVRGDAFLGIAHYESFRAYAESSAPYGKTLKEEEVLLRPAFQDFQLHSTFCWHDARLSRYFTLENRPNCEQPPEATLAVPALTLGLMEELGGVAAFLKEFTWEELREARWEAIQKGLDARVGRFPIVFLCTEMVRLAEKGLKKRALGEEVFLAPLWERIAQRECPADETRRVYRGEEVEGLLKRYRWEEYFRDL